MAIQVSNQAARRIFLERQGLSASPARALSKDALLQLIHDIGFVQVDSISTVERAHNQILFSRNQTFNREHLRKLLEEDRALFEHWTHDASILPTVFFPYWKHRFVRREQTIRERWSKWQGEGFDKAFEETYRRIAEGGELLAREMKAADHKSGGWWEWHPSKTALEFYWHTGKLAISRRENFQKVYDLTERVLPSDIISSEVSHAEFVDWACRNALQRLGFATHGEIAAFWDLISPAEASQWVSDHRSELDIVEIEPADGGKPRPSYVFQGFSPNEADWPDPPARIRVLSPFDPLLRDRNRAERLFGFRYRIEIFVPEPKREYGYYVFPLLEGDRLIGRIDMKTDRKAGTLTVKKLWLEPRVRASSGRMDKLDAELLRVARFSGAASVVYQDGFLA
jgi:uncharacterized protein